jgi:hypothetical protein
MAQVKQFDWRTVEVFRKNPTVESIMIRKLAEEGCGYDCCCGVITETAVADTAPTIVRANKFIGVYNAVHNKMCMAVCGHYATCDLKHHKCWAYLFFRDLRKTLAIPEEEE